MLKGREINLTAMVATALGAAIELLGRTGLPAYKAGSYLREVQREDLTTVRIVFWFDGHSAAEYTIYVLLFQLRDKGHDGWNEWVASKAVLHCGEDKFILDFDEKGDPRVETVIGDYPFWSPSFMKAALI